MVLCRSTAFHGSSLHDNLNTFHYKLAASVILRCTALYASCSSLLHVDWANKELHPYVHFQFKQFTMHAQRLQRTRPCLVCKLQLISMHRIHPFLCVMNGAFYCVGIGTYERYLFYCPCCKFVLFDQAGLADRLVPSDLPLHLQEQANMGS